MVICDCLGVLDATMTHFNFISVECFVKGVVFMRNGYPCEIVETKGSVRKMQKGHFSLLKKLKRVPLI